MKSFAIEVVRSGLEVHRPVGGGVLGNKAEPTSALASDSALLWEPKSIWAYSDGWRDFGKVQKVAVLSE